MVLLKIPINDITQTNVISPQEMGFYLSIGFLRLIQLPFPDFTLSKTHL